MSVVVLELIDSDETSVVNGLAVVAAACLLEVCAIKYSKSERRAPPHVIKRLLKPILLYIRIQL